MDQKKVSEVLKLPAMTLVTGGAASGKSAFAESLVGSTGLAKVYVATSRVYDTEMEAKVAAHIAQRGAGWRTLNAPDGLEDAFSQIGSSDVVLLDCATMWLTNQVMDDQDIEAALSEALTAIADLPCPVVIVSNELGQGIVPENALVRRFRNDHGRMNQALADQADWVFGVMSGLPFGLKGPDPRGLV